FTVGGQVNAGLTLEIEHNACGVEQRLLAGQRRKPIRDRIRADRGGEDARRAARVHKANGSVCELNRREQRKQRAEGSFSVASVCSCYFSLVTHGRSLRWLRRPP